MEVPYCSAALVDWLQAGASVAAILAGFGYVIFQRSRDTAATGRAAADLARHSLDFVTERLDAIIDPAEPIELALRGTRAAEMVEVLREIPVASLPPEMVEQVAIIRSSIYAVNGRIYEVLADDARRVHERRRRLYSSGKAIASARTAYNCLANSKAFKSRPLANLKPLSDRMTNFLDEAGQAPTYKQLSSSLI